MLLVILVLSASKSFGQGLPDSVIIHRMDSTAVSGYFLNYTGSGQPIHYSINHDTINHTVQVQLSAPDSVRFNFAVLDTTLQYVWVPGGVNNNTFTTSVNVNSLAASLGYLLFYFNTDFKNPGIMFFTTFK